MSRPLKKLPLTSELTTEVERLESIAWSSLNGYKLTREDQADFAYLLAEIRHYADHGRDGSCPAALHHGPGHQSRAECVLPAGHDAERPHESDYLACRWRGLTKFTGYFDELPEDDE